MGYSLTLSHRGLPCIPSRGAVLVCYAPFALTVVLLTFHLRMKSMVLVLWEVGAILGNGYGIQGQNYVTLLQGSRMPTGFHSRNLILGI